MKRIAAATALLALSAMGALAADMPQPVHPGLVVAPPSAYDWSGVYIGANVGYGTSAADVNSISFEGNPSGIPAFTIDGSGMLAGLTVGFNQQMDNIVIGVEGDYSWADISGDTFDNTYNFGVTTTVNSFATLRGRLGFAMDSAMLYATAGLAYGTIKGQLDDVYPGPTTVTTTDTATAFGWTAGLGAEIGVTDAISLKAEALYYDLGDETYNFYEGGGGWNPATAETSTTGWLGRIGANMRF